jgi:phage baseplate assembly protein W
MADFGTGSSALPDIGPATRLLSGLDNLAESLVRRFQTPRGALFYAPDEGLDLRQYLGEPQTPELFFEIETLVEEQAQRDERVELADATVTALDLRRIQVDLQLETAAGPFRLVLAVSALTVEVLYADTGGIVTT